MNRPSLKALVVLAGLAVAAGSADAAEVLVSSNISTSVTWTANNTYNLQKQIYVLPGATLTIEAGTVVASTTNLGGSLAVCRGARIYVQGTVNNPVIMTSKADVATWTGNDPKTGTWRASCQEWGNLTIMGKGYISEDATVGNTATPSASNVAAMEGLTAAGPNDPNVIYGGGDDDDNSGSISYLSLRYGGKVIALTNELNGLSLGGIGRGTDIHHVEIMNNVDDGIEIWGGTVNLKYVSIWNVGDDSFDIDQGWRGKAQFVLIVQGYSADAKQGSGVGDNCFETDGAENSDWQPVTTGVVYNATVIGQPTTGAGDGLTAWRDNARMQYRNCIFMDGGEKVVRFDNLDGDGAKGYGHNNTLTWAQTWTTAYTVTSTVNAPANPGNFYKSQTSGNLCEIKDSVFYNNNDAAAYTEADARGVFAAGNNNVKEPTTSPIVNITRNPIKVVFQKYAIQTIKSLDPRPAGDALTASGQAPNDGFFTPARYRGAFAPGLNWLAPWSASTAFGLTPKATFQDLGYAKAGINGDPVLYLNTTSKPTDPLRITIDNTAPNTAGVLAFSAGQLNVSIMGGTVVPSVVDPTFSVIPLPTANAKGAIEWNTTWPFAPKAYKLYFQAFLLDTAASANLAFSNAGVLTVSY